MVGAGAGSVIGGLAARGDAGLNNERLEALGQTLEPGGSAVVIVVPQVWVEAVEDQLEQTTAIVTTEVLDHDIAQQLTVDDDVA